MFEFSGFHFFNFSKTFLVPSFCLIDRIFLHFPEYKDMASLLNESFVDDKKEFRASVTDHCDYRATKKAIKRNMLSQLMKVYVILVTSVIAE